MKKTSIIFISLTILLVIIIGCLYNSYNKKNIQLQNLEISFDDQIYNALQNKDFLYLMALSSDGCKFRPIMTDYLNQKNFEQALNRVPKLVFYYSELNCNSCVEIIIKEVENFRDSIGSDNIVYISNYKRKRDMQIFRRINQIKSELYNISSSNIPIANVHVPFLFIINSDRDVCSVFIPNKENVKSIKSYLSIIRKKYFDKQNINYRKVAELTKERDNNLGIKTSIGVCKLSINLGKLSFQSKKQAIFKLKNTSKQALRIQSVNTSCGCTVAKYDKKPVLQGEIATVVLEYKPNKSGYFSKTADVVCNVPEGFVRLMISGEVVQK